jgi:hypothetical protein
VAKSLALMAKFAEVGPFPYIFTNELNHLAAILHVYAGDLNFMK